MKTIHTIIATVLLLSLMQPLRADNYLVKVNGIVCEFCSYGVAKKVSKLAFIDRDQLDRGVSVDIDNQLVTVAVRAGEPLDREALFAAIRSGGYDPVEIWRIGAEGERLAVEP